MRRTTLARLFIAHVLVAVPLIARKAAGAPPVPPEPPPASSESPAVSSAAPTASAPDAPATAPPREAAVTVLGSYTCTLEEHAGLDPDDAATTADVFCHALAAHQARPGVYDVVARRLGGRVLLIVTERESGSDRRLFVNGVEEVPTAADRLVDALVSGKTFDETLHADNVVSAETISPKQRYSQPTMYMGITEMVGPGSSTSPSAGVELDLDFRLQSLSLVMQGRAGGIGSGGDEMGYATLGGGLRYYLSESDTAAFVGGGASLAYFQANQTNASNFIGSGIAAYGELGVAFLRSARAGFQLAARADVPLFALSQSGTGATEYAVPLSFNLGITFR